MTHDRIGCSVPFCRRTIKDDGTFTEWICQNHWLLVSRKAKLIKRTAEVAFRTSRLQCEAIDAEALADMESNGRPGIEPEIFDRFCAAANHRDKKARQANRAWDRCKRQAIEAAGGIR